MSLIRGEYKYNPGVAVQDGLDAIFETHDKNYGYRDIRLEGGDITPGQATVETMSADLQLIKDSMLYNPITDPLLPNDKILKATDYCGAVIVAFTAKMLYNMDQLISTASEDAIDAAGKLIEDLLSSGTNVSGGILGSLFDDILNRLSGLFTSAATAAPPKRIDPIIIDLDGDGIETIGVKSGAYFDHDGNGFAEKTGWAAPDDGLLVMDRNGDEIINDGKELFGDQTILANGQKASNGFAALADLDDNHDGKIDSNDAAYSQLRVWQDVDGDGLSAPDELHTLEELGIQSVSTQSEISNTTDPEGNTQTRIGSFVKTDNTTGQIGSYNLQRNTAYTIAENWLNVPDDIAALPDIQGYGNVYDLQQAMSQAFS